MKTAEEFFKQYYTNPVYVPKDKHDKRIPKWDYYDILDFAEAYHKAKVDEIKERFEVHKKNLQSIKDGDVVESKIYWFPKEELEQLLKQ